MDKMKHAGCDAINGVVPSRIPEQVIVHSDRGNSTAQRLSDCFIISSKV